MPIYSYECKSCRARFEVKQSIVEDPIKVCPECEGEIRRIIYPVGIVFKGSGFYSTDNSKSKSDYASESDTSSAKSETSSKSETTSKVDKKEPATASTGDKKTDS